LIHSHIATISCELTYLLSTPPHQPKSGGNRSRAPEGEERAHACAAVTAPAPALCTQKPALCSGLRGCPAWVPRRGCRGKEGESGTHVCVRWLALSTPTRDGGGPRTSLVARTTTAQRLNPNTHAGTDTCGAGDAAAAPGAEQDRSTLVQQRESWPQPQREGAGNLCATFGRKHDRGPPASLSSRRQQCTEQGGPLAVLSQGQQPQP
jgi:hypothetical protein